MYLMQKQCTPIAFTEIKRVNSNQVLLIKVHHSTIRRNIHKWKTFNIARKFTPRSEWVMQRENAEHPRATSQTYRLHLKCQMLKFMTVPLKKQSMACLEKLPRESLLYKNNIAAGLQSLWTKTFWTNHKTSGKMSLGQKRPKLRGLVHSFMSDKTIHPSSSSCQGEDKAGAHCVCILV